MRLVAEFNAIEAYRQRAADIRAEANSMSSIHLKKRLLETADCFDALARALEKQQFARKHRLSGASVVGENSP